MTKRTYGHTSSGTPIDDDLIERLADEAAAGYDPDVIISRGGRRGRPPAGRPAVHRRVRPPRPGTEGTTRAPRGGRRSPRVRGHPTGASTASRSELTRPVSPADDLGDRASANDGTNILAARPGSPVGALPHDRGYGLVQSLVSARAKNGGSDRFAWRACALGAAAVSVACCVVHAEGGIEEQGPVCADVEVGQRDDRPG